MHPFGKNVPLPQAKHVDAATQGSPVTYTVGMNVGGVYQDVVRYRLGLRPFSSKKDERKTITILTIYKYRLFGGRNYDSAATKNRTNSN